MNVSRVLRIATPMAIAILLSACGTTYNLPGIDESVTSRASSMFADAKAAPPRKLASPSTGEHRFRRVAHRVEPVARQLCERELAADKTIDCNVRLELDREMQERNAYFTYAKAGNKSPVIRFSLPILQDAESDDEVAFIMGHEYGHLIGQHIQKQQQQAIAGALLLGAVAAYSNAQAASAGTYYDPNDVSRSVELGAAVGQRAFSQTYELESDMLGTRIATWAGYDAVKGAKFFARDEAARSKAGQLSFWGTHPSDAKRLAVVIATMEEIKAKQALTRKAK
ncbi:M48 family metalloprotease [Defluviimonas sp. D31]|uniref:M48 family metalloprotease n=1 Tax=Defluviimonas sp. D31 TaxID=3083253 RepID=UPI00296ED631|nr:M48 family metalloprotease [Defluviimonas sp. D31]MDW4548405.1 M48 family metalloprotease [Defluviimonas sp. D31]